MLENKTTVLRQELAFCSVKALLSSYLGRDLLSEALDSAWVKEEEGERGELAFLQDLLSPGAAGGTSEFSKAWQDAFGCFEDPPAPVTAPSPQAGTTANTPTGFLPSQLLDLSLSATGLHNLLFALCWLEEWTTQFCCAASIQCSHCDVHIRSLSVVQDGRLHLCFKTRPSNHLPVEDSLPRIVHTHLPVVRVLYDVKSWQMDTDNLRWPFVVLFL